MTALKGAMQVRQEPSLLQVMQGGRQEKHWLVRVAVVELSPGTRVYPLSQVEQMPAVEQVRQLSTWHWTQIPLMSSKFPLHWLQTPPVTHTLQLETLQ